MQAAATTGATTRSGYIAELARDGVIGRPGGNRMFALRDLTAPRNLSA
jgi:hypothetical protein